jgi:hypothetical protein
MFRKLPLLQPVVLKMTFVQMALVVTQWGPEDQVHAKQKFQLEVQIDISLEVGIYISLEI